MLGSFRNEQENDYSGVEVWGLQINVFSDQVVLQLANAGARVFFK